MKRGRDFTTKQLLEAKELVIKMVEELNVQRQR